MQVIQTPGDNRPLPANEEFDDQSVGGSAAVMNPMLSQLRESFGELDAQMHGNARPGERSPTGQAPAITPSTDDRARLQEAHAQVAALLAERNQLSAKLQSTSSTLAHAMQLVQKQRTALLDARMAQERQENAIRQLNARTEHYQETVARLLNLPPQGASRWSR